MLCLRKIPVEKYSMDKLGGGIKIFQRNFLISQCRKLSYRNTSVLCFRKIPVAKEIMDKRGWGVYHDSPSENFGFTVQKIFVGEHFCAVLEKNCSSEKLYG